MVHSLRILVLALLGVVIAAAGNLRSAAPPANLEMQLVEAIAAHHPTAGEQQKHLCRPLARRSSSIAALW